MAVRASRSEQQSIGFYQPIIELGRGGMGTVYVARATGAAGFERLVVLKRLHPHLLDEADAVQRFLDEARMAAWIQHANVVSTHQVGSDDHGYFLVLEYVEGVSLEELIDRAALRGERIPPPIALRIALDALSGLQAAHTAKDASGRPLEILHRDVTLQNVLVGRDGVGRVADFGIAKSAIGNVKTDRAYVVGKLLYLPPEYLRREAFGPPLDVYSLGVTLWLTLTGKELFAGASEAQLLTHILEEGIPRLSSAMEVPPQIDELVSCACDPNPVLRYQTARSMAEALEKVARETGWLATHGEVGDYIENLAGKDLDRRRALIAERIAKGEQVTFDGPELPSPSIAPLPLADERALPAFAPEDDALSSIPGERKAWPRIALGLGALLAVAALGAVTWRAVASDAPEPAAAAPLVTATAAGSTAPPAPPAVEPAVTGTPSELATAVPPSDPSETEEPQPAVPKPRAPVKPPTSKKTSGGGARAPDEISKTNPYRR